MLEFRYLPAFFAVAEHGSFTEAGKRLHIATSAVSRQIQLLEEACSVQLFFRAPRAARLTPSGARLFAELRHFSAQAATALGAATREPLRLGTLQGVLRHWLVNVVAETPYFRTVNLELRVGNPSDLIAAVEAGELDATFFSRVHLTTVPASMRAFRLFPEDIVLISKAPVELADIDNHPWICLSLQSWLVKYFRREPASYIIVNDMDAVVELVRRGLGVAMVPAYAAAAVKGLSRRPIAKFGGEAICLVTRRYQRVPPVLAELLTIVRRNAPLWKELA